MRRKIRNAVNAGKEYAAQKSEETYPARKSFIQELTVWGLVFGAAAAGASYLLSPVDWGLGEAYAQQSVPQAVQTIAPTALADANCEDDYIDSYKVRHKDTLFSIVTEEFGLPADEIGRVAAQNDIRDIELIYVGETLCLYPIQNE